MNFISTSLSNTRRQESLPPPHPPLSPRCTDLLHDPASAVEPPRTYLSTQELSENQENFSISPAPPRPGGGRRSRTPPQWPGGRRPGPNAGADRLTVPCPARAHRGEYDPGDRRGDRVPGPDRTGAGDREPGRHCQRRGPAAALSDPTEPGPCDTTVTRVPPQLELSGVTAIRGALQPSHRAGRSDGRGLGYRGLYY
eukprot:768379-Hanusia_phi.AAC.3